MRGREVARAPTSRPRWRGRRRARRGSRWRSPRRARAGPARPRRPESRVRALEPVTVSASAALTLTSHGRCGQGGGERLARRCPRPPGRRRPRRSGPGARSRRPACPAAGCPRARRPCRRCRRRARRAAPPRRAASPRRAAARPPRTARSARRSTRPAPTGRSASRRATATSWRPIARASSASRYHAPACPPSTATIAPSRPRCRAARTTFAALPPATTDRTTGRWIAPGDEPVDGHGLVDRPRSGRRRRRGGPAPARSRSRDRHPERRRLGLVTRRLTVRAAGRARRQRAAGDAEPERRLRATGPRATRQGTRRRTRRRRRSCRPPRPRSPRPAPARHPVPPRTRRPRRT